MADYEIKLSKIIEELKLTEAYMPKPPEEIMISSRDVNRPGIELNGYFEYFDETRISIMGRAECSMLDHFGEEKKREAIDAFLKRKPPVVIISRGIEPDDFYLECAEKYEVPILLTDDSTSNVLAALVAFLNVQLAPRVTRHGVLVEVYGEGILLVGDSGVGKSETAMELMKRGHRLIADDAVEIKRVSNISLVGQSPENIRYFIELRGIGIINARRIFGMSAVKDQEKIDMCINMELWDATKIYDRIGMDNDFTEILGVKVPVMTIPVRPGRNLAIIIEVAAMSRRQKKMGYNAAQELLSNLGMDIEALQAGETGREIKI